VDEYIEIELPEDFDIDACEDDELIFFVIEEEEDEDE
jgi:hypothetical protein